MMFYIRSCREPRYIHQNSIADFALTSRSICSWFRVNRHVHGTAMFISRGAVSPCDSHPIYRPTEAQQAVLILERDLERDGTSTS